MPINPAPQPPERIYVNEKCAVIPMNGVYTLRSHEGDVEYVRADIAASRAQPDAQTVIDAITKAAQVIIEVAAKTESRKHGVPTQGTLEMIIRDFAVTPILASRADVDAFHRGVNAAKDAIRSEDGDGCPNFCASIFINAIARKCGNDPGVAVDAAQGDILKERQRCALIAEAVNDSMRDEGKFARNILNPDTCLIPRSRGTYAISPEHVFDNRGQCVYCAECRAAPPLAVEQECEALKTLNILESEMRASAEREVTELASTISNVRGVLQLLPEGLQTDSRFKPYLSALLAALQSTADSACAKHENGAPNRRKAK